MKNAWSLHHRKQIEKKLIEAFADEVKALTPELQQIMADDLVTAFQNRMTALLKIQSKGIQKSLIY